MASDTKTSGHLVEVDKYDLAIKEFRFNDAVAFVWKKITNLNQFIDNEKPWELIKNHDKRTNGVLAHAVDSIQEIAALLEPFLPATAYAIEEQFKGPEIKAQAPLFPRI